MQNPLIEPLEARIAPAGVFTIAKQADVFEGDAGERDLVFVVTLTGTITSEATVHFKTENVTATAGSDYTAIPDTVLTFQPGETQMFVTVKVQGDTVFENDEAVRVRLSAPSGATLDPLATRQLATALIKNDDVPPMPTISITDATVVEGDNGTTMAVFHVELSNVFTEEVTVNVATQGGGTATSGVDFVANSTLLRFAPNVRSLDFTVLVNGDFAVEGDEMFNVLLSNPTKSSLGKATGIGTITDDDPNVSVASVSRLEGNSGDTVLTFNVTLSAASTREVRVNFATQDGSATSTGPAKDFDALAGELVFAPGVTTLPVSITIHGDTLSETNETFLLNLTAPTNAKITGGQATGTILNDEPSLRIDDVQVVEGDSGQKQAVFTVTLDNAPTVGNVTVDVNTSDGSATANSDYLPLFATTLTFTPGQTTKQVSVAILGDRIAEGNETFFVNLSNVTSAAITDGTGMGTILSDDGILRIGDARVVEGANGTREAVFTVTLENGPLTGNVTVNFATQDGTAISTGASKDFDALTGVLTFAPGETAKEVRVTVNGDALAERDETFSVKLSGASATAVIGDDTGAGTIVNDDGSFLTINDVSITEGDSGFANLVFLVQLAAPSGQPFSVSVNTAPGTALSSGPAPDFTAVTTSLTFNAGETQKLVSVPVRGDLIREGAENFSVVLSNVVALGNAIVTILDDTGIGTINDNNDPVPTVSIGAATVAEGNAGTTVLRFTATLSQPAGSTITANFSTHNDGSGAHPATAGADYTAVANGTITFAAGESVAFIDVPIVGDTVDEFDETFGLTIFNPVGATLGTSEAIGTIQNDEVTIAIGDFSLAEGNGGTTTFVFQVALTTPGGVPIQNAVTVNFASADGTAISTGANPDFNATQGALTFTPGGPRVQNVVVTGNGDARFEGAEQFFVNLLSSVNAAILDGQGVGTIFDDDPVRISIADAAITEGNGNSTLNFTLSLDRISDLAVSVRASTVDGSAVDGADFTAFFDQLITIPAGQTSGTVSVNIIGDTTDETLESFTVILSGATNATLLDGTAFGLITDNDLRTLSVGDVSVVEGDAGTKEVTFIVSLSSVASLPVSFNFSTANNSALAGQDYFGKSGTVTIPAGAPSSEVRVSVIGDTAVEGNERFFLNLSNAVNGLISGTAGQARAIIVDDEARLRLVAAGSARVAEDGGTFADFRVERSGDTSQLVSVQFETRDVTTTSAGALADYTGNSGTITFAAGSNAASGTIRVAIIGDLNYEFDETFNVRLFNPLNAAVFNSANVLDLEGSAAVTIVDNDVAPTLSIVPVDAAAIVEGDAGSTQQKNFTVRLSAANERDVVTVDYVTQDETANSKASTAGLLQDYEGTGGVPVTLIFNKGVTEQTVSIAINGDARDEIDLEVFQVKLSAPTNAAISVATVDVTISDDDAAPTITFSPGTDITVAEGSSGTKNATVTLALSEVSENAISVQYTTKDGTAISTAGSRQDFAGADHVVATYPGTSGLRTFSFDIPIIGDTLDEADETFRVVLSDAVNARLGDIRGTVTIIDDDLAPVITINSVGQSEGNSGTTEMIFTVALSAASGQEVTVSFASLDGTGNSGASSTGVLADFVATSGTLTFAPEETQKEIRVTIKGDLFKETDEIFSVRLAEGVNGTFVAGADFGTGTILTDGDTTLGIAINDAFSVEGDSGGRAIVFTVELSQANPTIETTFNIVATNGTAARGSDFLLVAVVNGVPSVVGQLSGGIAAGAKSTTVTVQVNGDGVFEPTESFFLSLRDVANAAESIVMIAGGSARGTIFNDDLRRLDANTLQFIDVDGDLVTIHVSHGTLLLGDLAFGEVNDVGGRQLQTINFIGDTRFQNADLTVTARHQPGFKGNAQGVRGDGHVNVGAIFAASVRADILQFINGIDLGTVTIDGDLGRIVVGDDVVTPAIGALVVRSMGRFGTETQGGLEGQSVTSLVLGPVGSFIVHGDFMADFRVLGSQFGSIKYLQIDGALRGGDEPNSGAISFTGKLKSGYIGRVVGGLGDNSGTLSGTGGVDSKIGSLVVGGRVSGGAGAGSGVISAPTIKSLRIGSLMGGTGSGDNLQSLGSGVISAGVLEKLIVKKDIIGGSGENSGQILVNTSAALIRIEGGIQGGDGPGSGSILERGKAERISVFGTVAGGAGANSGRIKAVNTVENLQTGALVGGSGANSGKIAGSSIRNLSVFGNVEGGSGDGSGGIELSGRLTSGFIGGDIAGGDAQGGATLLKSGYVTAHRILNLEVQGSLSAGTNGGDGLAMSGTIRADTSIGSLHIRGSVVGSDEVAAIIAAPGNGKRAAIASLRIDGEARFAEILAGYGESAALDNARGLAVNSDAQIGRVSIGAGVRNSSIIAGADAGVDGRFGTGDDLAIGGEGTVNDAGTVSKIARIVIGGTVRSGTRAAGFVAQFVDGVKVQGSTVPLAVGAGNDGAPGSELAEGSKIRVFEVPVV